MTHGYIHTISYPLASVFSTSVELGLQISPCKINISTISSFVAKQGPEKPSVTNRIEKNKSHGHASSYAYLYCKQTIPTHIKYEYTIKKFIQIYILDIDRMGDCKPFLAVESPENPPQRGQDWLAVPQRQMPRWQHDWPHWPHDCHHDGWNGPHILTIWSRSGCQLIFAHLTTF